ncbi:MAG TPA: universal stress protein [Stellaceae bacterium]|jgi:nucleotide-binding universal stress UspA family protein|nr:universal stress protein [Stellaceae bacterium]
MYKNVLIATDGSPLATHAAKQGIALAKAVGAKVTAVNVTEPFHWFAPNLPADAQPAYVQGMQQVAARALGIVADAAKAAGVSCEMAHIEAEHPYEAIIETAISKHCDLIVMASHGRSAASAVLLGSETMKVLTHSKIPVLVYR